jgi:hypothetical protein
MLPLPLGFLAGWLTGGVGGLPLLFFLLAYQFVELMADDSADHHTGLVIIVAVFFYFAAFSLLALPAHALFRGRGFAHVIALCLVTLVFAVLMAFAFPMRGLPI